MSVRCRCRCYIMLSTSVIDGAVTLQNETSQVYLTWFPCLTILWLYDTFLKWQTPLTEVGRGWERELKKERGETFRTPNLVHLFSSASVDDYQRFRLQEWIWSGYLKKWWENNFWRQVWKIEKQFSIFFLKNIFHSFNVNFRLFNFTRQYLGLFYAFRFINKTTFQYFTCQKQKGTRKEDHRMNFFRYSYSGEKSLH